MLKKRFNQIKELAQQEALICDEFKGLAFIAEELGELAKDLIENNKEHARLEAIDIMIYATFLFYILGGNETELDYRLKRQISKRKQIIKE